MLTFVTGFAPLDVAKGIITGIGGLFYGTGPALFGFIFYLFHVDLNDSDPVPTPPGTNKTPNIFDGHMLHHIHEVSSPIRVEIKLKIIVCANKTACHWLDVGLVTLNKSDIF